MDNLAREAMLAKEAGIHYGKWKAMNQNTSVNVKHEIPEGWKACEHCGKPFKPKCGQRFCDIECRNKAYADREKAIRRDYYLNTYKYVRKEKRNADKNND